MIRSATREGLKTATHHTKRAPGMQPASRYSSHIGPDTIDWQDSGKPLHLLMTDMHLCFTSASHCHYNSSAHDPPLYRGEMHVYPRLGASCLLWLMDADSDIRGWLALRDRREVIFIERASSDLPYPPPTSARCAISSINSVFSDLNCRWLHS